MKKISSILLMFLIIISILPFVPLGSCTGTIIYDSGTDTITLTYGTIGIPITPNDIYLADIAGGWGQVTENSYTQTQYSVTYTIYQYVFECKLQIGDGSINTYFTAKNTEMMFTVYGSTIITVKNNAVLTFGQILNNTIKSSANGISLSCTTNANNIIYGESGSYINIYSSKISQIMRNTASTAWIRSVSGGNLIIWNSILNGISPAQCLTSDLYRVTVTYCDQKGLDNVAGTINDVIVTNCQRGIFDNSYDYLYVNNSKIFDCSYTVETYKIIHLINCDTDKWNVLCHSSTGIIYREYTFDLSVLNSEVTDFINNANVSIYKNNIKIGSWNTNSSGQIPTQTLMYGFYNETGGNNIYDAQYPFIITIQHPDWMNYTCNFFITEKTKMTICMQNSSEFITITESQNDIIAVSIIVACVICLVCIFLLTKRR